MNDSHSKILVSEPQLLIYGDIGLSNEQVAAVREIARFVGERVKVIIEWLGELDAGARALEIDVRVDS